MTRHDEMMRHDEQTDERLRTEDLMHAGGTEPAERDDFRPSNDDFRSTEDDQHLPVAGENGGPAGDAHTEPADRQEIRDAELDDADHGADHPGGFTGHVREPADTVDTTMGDTPDDVDDVNTVDTVDEMDTVDGTADTGYGSEIPATPAAGAEEPPPAAMPSNAGDEVRQLFGPADIERFRSEWLQVQTMFVDDPRDAVQSADHLVAEVIQSLATTFNEHKRELEGHWREGADTQTEELRIALRRYRSFFNQLLDV